MIKKVIKIVVILFLIAVLAVIGLISYWEIASQIPLSTYEDKVTKIINKEYADYEIESLELEYVDWSSTITNAEEGDIPTKATVVIKNDVEERVLHFEKEFFMWKITSSEPISGVNVPNGIYYIEENYCNAGKLVDIEECIKNSWILPNHEGKTYSKVGEGEDWYYSYKVCENIYKTMDGYVYVFNRDIEDWERAEESYADMEYYSNYERIKKDYAMELIEKYSSYREN